MRDKKKAHKLRCVDASVDKKKQLIMRASMCVCGLQERIEKECSLEEGSQRL